MELDLLKKNDKKILENLAKEFSEDFLNNFKEDNKVIGLYGTKDKEVLDFFRSKLQTCLLKEGRDIPIISGEIASYNINVDFFLKGPGYFKGLNDEY